MDIIQTSFLCGGSTDNFLAMPNVQAHTIGDQMDSASKNAISILEALAQINQQFIQFFLAQRVMSYVVASKHEFECREYITKYEVQIYIDLELSNGSAISWILQLSWVDENWILEASIKLNSDATQETIVYIPELKIATLNLCIARLKEYAQLLLDKKAHELINDLFN